MRSTWKLLVAGGFAVSAALAACTPHTFESWLHVESYFNPNGNCGSYRTYGWVD